MHLVPHRRPAVALALRAEQRCEPDRAVQRHPAHDLRRHVLPVGVARLPHAGVGTSPCVGRLVGERDQELTILRSHVLQLGTEQVRGVQDLAEHVELALAPRVIAGPYGRAAGVPPQVRQLVLAEVALPLDPVHDRHRLVADLPGGPSHPRQQAVGLVRTGRDPQRSHREREIAQPGEAVVVVAVPSELLGERRGCGGHDRAAALVRESLQDDRAAQHLLAVATVVRLMKIAPGPPGVDGRGDA